MMKIKLNCTLSKPLPQLMKAQVGGVEVRARLVRTQQEHQYKALPDGAWRTDWAVELDIEPGSGSVASLIYPTYL